MADEFEQKSKALVDWLSAQPEVSISPKIKLMDCRDRGAGRGVQAVQDITQDEDLFSIPRAAVLSIDTSDLKTKLPQFLSKDVAEGSPENQELRDNPFSVLLLVLLYEHLLGDQSRWKAYLDVLPKEFNTLMFWTDEEVKELQSSAVVDKIGRESAESVFDSIIVPLVRQSPSTFYGSETMSDTGLKSLAHKMASIIMSYAFDVENEEEEDDENEVDDDGYITYDEDSFRQGMVPLADMLNADAEPNASLFQGQGMLTMRSLRPISFGEEILNDYGQLPRSDLLRRYGYLTPNYAKFDCVELDREWLDRVLSSHHSLDASEIEKRTEYLEERELLDESYDIVWPGASDNMDYFPNDLSRYVKTILADEQQWKSAAKSGFSNEDLMAKFMSAMSDVVTKRRAQYSSALDADLQLLKEQAAQGRLRMAIEVRSGEKKILAAAHERLQEATKSTNGQAASKRQKIS